MGWQTPPPANPTSPIVPQVVPALSPANPTARTAHRTKSKVGQALPPANKNLASLLVPLWLRPLRVVLREPQFVKARDSFHYVPTNPCRPRSGGANMRSREAIVGHQFAPADAHEDTGLIRVHRRSSAADRFFPHPRSEPLSEGVSSRLQAPVGAARCPVGQAILPADSLSSESNRPPGRPMHQPGGIQ